MSFPHAWSDVLIVVLQMMQVSWNAALCHWMTSTQYLQGQAEQEELSLLWLLDAEDELQSSDASGTIRPMT